MQNKSRLGSLWCCLWFCKFDGGVRIAGYVGVGENRPSPTQFMITAFK